MPSQAAQRAHDSHEYELLGRSAMNGVPATVGRYRLQEPLGRGGDAPLYRATDPLDRQVVIRLFPEQNEELQRRFVREALPALRLRHPHLVSTLELGGDTGRPFVVMEYFEGRTLADVIDHGAPLPVPRALSLIEQLCSAVAFARARHLLHREVRPDDVLVAGDGVLKLVDRGISRPLEPGAAPALDEFIAPERAAGAPPDARSDVYMVGCVMLNLLAVRRTSGTGATDGVAGFGRSAPDETDGPGVDPDILRIVDRCVAREPERRYPDAEALARELQRVSARLHDVEPDSKMADPATLDPADPEPERPLAIQPSNGPRAPADREDRDRQRARAAPHLETAVLAIDAGDWQRGIAACEAALASDRGNATALALVERARTALAAREVADLLARAGGELANNNLAAALALVERAAACGAAQDDVIRMRDQCARARRARELAPRRESAPGDRLARAHRQFERGGLHDAIATLDDLHIIDPAAHASDAQRADAESLRECIGDVLAAEARELRRQHVAAEVMRVRGELDRDEYRQALDRLAALEDGDDWSPELTELRIVAQEGLAEAEVLAARARMLSGHVAAAASLFAQNDLAGSLSRIQAALAISPAHQPALALRGMIENRVLELAEQQRAHERQAHPLASRPRPDRDDTFAPEHVPGQQAMGAAGDTVIVPAGLRPIQVRFSEIEEGPEAFLSEDGGLDELIAAERDPGGPPRIASSRDDRAPLDLPLRDDVSLPAPSPDFDDPADPALRFLPSSPPTEVAARWHGPVTAAPAPTVLATSELPAAAEPRTGARHQRYALYGSIALAAAAVIAFVAWMAAMRSPAVAPERFSAVETTTAPIAAPPIPEPVAPAPGPQPQAATSSAPQSRTPTAVPPPVRVTVQPAAAAPAAVASPPPQAVALPPPPASSAARAADISPARRIDELRDTARRQFERGEGQQALTTVSAGLELAPADPVLRQMLETTLNEARDDAVRARSAGLAAASAVATSATWREADLRSRDAARSAQIGSAVEAVRGYWMASALFARAASEAQLQSGLPAAPAAAPVARDPEEARSSVTPPPPAVSAPSVRETAATGAATTPVVPRRAPPSDEPAIHATLRAYAAAYTALDAGAVRRVFPSVNEPALRRAFSGLRSQEVEIEGEQLTVNGDTVTVSCRLVTLAIGQVGASTPRRDSRRVTFTLAKQDGAWVIVDRR